MIDRPRRADPRWLAEIQAAFGAYQLAAMTQTGKRGIVCQMHIAPENLLHLKTLESPLTPALRAALMPLPIHPPAVTLALHWDPASQAWISTIVKGEPMNQKFAFGQAVATPGALEALAEAGQEPIEFRVRHQGGDWGELDEEDKRENELSVKKGFRILSAYTLTTGVKIWIITEADRPVTTILLPQEY
jgi:hypothetical protein